MPFRKTEFLFLIPILSTLFFGYQYARFQTTQKNTAMSVYDFTMKGIDGKEIPLSSYQGKYLLLVNVASECGYTPQYEDLQLLHEKHGDKVAILGFPANNFGGQEPGSNQQIASFCKKNYGVEFQMFEKISVAGSDQHPLYQWLSNPEENGWNNQSPTWNFCKYLISPEGKLLKFFPSSVNPFDEQIIDAISE